MDAFCSLHRLPSTRILPIINRRMSYYSETLAPTLRLVKVIDSLVSLHTMCSNTKVEVLESRGWQSQAIEWDLCGADSSQNNLKASVASLCNDRMVSTECTMIEVD